MGSITERKRKDGTTGYRAEIVRKRAGKVVLKLTETFDRRKAAQDWIDAKEKALEKPGALDAAIAAKKLPTSSTLGDAINRTLTGRVKEVGRITKDNPRREGRQRRLVPPDAGGGRDHPGDAADRRAHLPLLI
jgi:hypothetical protein